jgi:hypothetical protein
MRPRATGVGAQTLICAHGPRAPESIIVEYPKSPPRRVRLLLMEPGPHMNLARALRDQGQALSAFAILEEARRTCLDETEFHEAFAAAFLDDHFDNSPAAEAQDMQGFSPRNLKYMRAFAAWRQNIRRNLDRFPEDFKFHPTAEELDSLRSQSDFRFQLTREERDEVVTNCDHLRNLKYAAALPWAFTEHGSIMVAIQRKKS